jgi:hypothetical protein
VTLHVVKNTHRKRKDVRQMLFITSCYIQTIPDVLDEAFYGQEMLLCQTSKDLLLNFIQRHIKKHLKRSVIHVLALSHDKICTLQYKEDY